MSPSDSGSRPASAPPDASTPYYRWQRRVYRRLLGVLPGKMLALHADDMVALFADHLHATRRAPRARFMLWVRALVDLISHAPALRRRFARTRLPFRHAPHGDPTMTDRLRSFASGLRRDALYAIRLLRKDWSFTLTATLILGLAIGANTAIFSFVDTYLLRPLPYPDPDRLARVSRTWTNGAVGLSQDGFTWEAIQDYGSDDFTAAVYSTMTPSVNLAAGGRALNVRQQRIGAGFFATLGVTPALGREFLPAEDVPDGPAVTILSHGLWQRLFSGDRGIIGESISLRGEPFTVVGVMPADFRSRQEADLYTPLRPNTTGEGGGTNYAILVRIDAETDWIQAESQIAAIGTALLEGDYSGGRFDRLSMSPLQEADTAGLKQPLRILWVAVGAVLLIACVNVSGLMLVRGNRRQREIATRLAIGGDRGAITRQLLVESVVLAALGGAFGVLLANLMISGLQGLGRGVLDSWRPVSIDARVLLVSAGVTMATALLFGLAPAIQARGVSLHDALRSGGRAVSGQTRMGRKLLVVTEVGLSVVLLVMAGLLLRTFLHARGLDPGFDARNLVTVSVSLQDARYATRDQVTNLFEEGLRRVRDLPATASATAALGVPYERQLNMGFQPLDWELPPDANQISNVVYVSDDYFDTLAVRILGGRPIGLGDSADSEPVAVVNQAFASTYMGEIEPVDRGVAVAGFERRIVGVSGNVKHVAGWGGLEPLDDVPTIYVPVSQLQDGFFTMVHTWFAPAWLVRVNGDPRTVIPEIERAVGSVDPLLPIARTRLAAQVQAAAISDQRFIAVLVTALAGASVILAALGIWGLVASTVVEQRRDIGIRMALGAGPTDAVSVVAKPSLKLAVIGAAVGVAGAFYASRALTAMLWGVTPGDPVTYVGVGLTLLVAAAVASLVPAMRAARLDPARTLQAE